MKNKTPYTKLKDKRQTKKSIHKYSCYFLKNNKQKNNRPTVYRKAISIKIIQKGI